MKDMRKLWTIVAIFLCYINTHAQCTASFSFPSIICSGQSISLTNTSGIIDSSLWYWSGANTGSTNYVGVTSLSNSFSNPGLTHICLIAVNGTCKDTACHDITVVQSPASPAFTYSPSSNICSGTPVSFSVTAPQGGTSYSWSFQGGGTASGTSSSHTFSSIGSSTTTFSVTLTATKNGCSTSTSQNISIKQQPDAAIVDVANTQEYTNCGGGNLDVEIVSTSTTQSTNTNYTINWGDGSALYSGSTIPSTPPGVTHSYSGSGYFTITETVTSNGCSASNTYSAFNGTNPSGSLGNPGGTTGLCSPASLSFPINGAGGNTPGTLYIITVNDGTAPDTFSQPPPPSFSHIFNLSSCGYTTPSYTNSFYVKMQAINQCNSSTIIVDPITINSKPQANFTISPDTVVCINTNVTFTNSSIGGALVNNSNVCDSTNILNWVISPSTGYTIVSGQLGSNPPTVALTSTWGSSPLTVNFTSPGVYSIKLKIRSKSACGTDSIVKTVCVLSPPTPQFNLSSTISCAPFIVTPNNTSVIPSGCSPTSIAWTVSKTSTPCPGDSAVDFRFISGTTLQSLTPTIRFNNSGTYTLNLSLTNKCGTFPAAAQTITVKSKPVASIPPPPSICAGQVVNFSASSQACGGTISGYSWAFTNGNPLTSTSSTPSVVFNGIGVDNVSLSVTNECGTTIVPTTVSVLGTPLANAGPDRVICSNNSVQLGAAPTSGLSYTWTPSTGLSSTVISNPTVQLTNSSTLPVNYTFIVTATNSANCSSNDTVIVTVNPGPSVIISPINPALCIGRSIRLTATGALNYSWSPSTGLSNITGDTVNAHPSSTTTYTVTGTDGSSCSATTNITVSVNLLPNVSAGQDTQVCNQPIPIQLTGAPSGGTWSGTGISTTGSFTPSSMGNFTEYYTYTDGNTCTNIDSAVIHVVSPSTANAGPDSTICQFAPSVQLNGVPAGGSWSGSIFVSSSGLFSTSTSGTYKLIYTYGSGSCANRDTMTMTVNAQPTINVIPANPSICVGRSIRLTASGGSTYSWSPSNGLSGISGDTVNAHPLISTLYTVTGTNSNNCSATATVNVVINQLPAVSAGLDTQVCNQPFAIQLTGSPAGGTWSGTGISSSGSFTPSVTGTFKEFYSYTDGNTCANVDSMNITVISANPANAGRDSTVCQYAPSVQLSGSPSGGTWSGNPNVSPSGLFTTTTSGSFALVYTYGSGSCQTYDSMTLTVNPIPSIAIVPSTPSICLGDHIKLQVSGANTYSWSPAATLSSNYGDTVNAHPISNTMYTVVGLDTITGCTAVDSVLLIIKPLPAVTNNPLRQVICSGSSSAQITLTANVPGTTFSWTAAASPFLTGYTTTGNGVIPSQILTNSDNLIHNVLYTIQPIANGCNGNIATDTIQVSPIPSITLPSPQTICSGDTSSLVHVIGSIPGTLIQWTASAAFGLSGYSTNGVGDIPSQHLYNSNSAASDVTFTVSDTLNGCGGPSLNYNITVNPSPSVQFSLPDQILCSGDLSSNVVLSSNSSGASISWTATIPAGISGASASGTNTIPASTLSNSTHLPLTIVYQAQASTTNVICPGTTAFYNITVNPTPDLAISVLDDTICSTTDAISHFSSNVSGTSFSWIATYPSQISGASSGSGDSIHQTLINSDSIPHSVNYSISTTAANCPGQTGNIVIQVNPSPQISFSIPDQSICSADNSQQVMILSSTPGAVFSWTATVPSSITGAILSGSNIIPVQTLINSSSIVQTVNYVVTTNFNGCSGPANQYIISVKPTPHLINTDTLLIVCSQDTLQPIALLSDVTGATFTWTSAGPGSLSGYTPSGNTSVIPAQVILNTSNVSDTLLINIVPEANLCVGPSRVIKVIVRPLPQMTLTPDSQIQCSGFNSMPVTITSSIPNTTFVWSGTPVNIAGSILSDSTAIIPSMYLTNNSITADTGFIRYSVNPLAGGCPGSTLYAFIEVDPKPIPDFAIAQSVLCSPSPVSIASDGMVFGHPDSLTFQWGDGTHSVVYPNAAPPIWSNTGHLYSNPSFYADTFTITLTAHNHCGDSSVSHDVVVLPNTINAFFNSSVSTGCAPLSVTFTDYSNGGTTASWCFEYDTVSHTCNGPGQVVPLHSVVTQTFGSGTHIIALFINDGCSFDTVFHVIHVNDSTSAAFGFIDNQCKGQAVKFNDSSYTAIGSFITGYNWSFGDGDSSNITSPSHVYDTTGILQACLTVSSSSGCNSTACKPINIAVTPIAAFTDTNACLNSQPSLFRNQSQNAAFYLWDFGDGNTDNTQNPQHTFVDSGHYTISLIASTGQCADTSIGIITIYPKPHSQFALPASYSCGLPSLIDLTNLSTGATGYIWDFGNGTLSTNISPTAQYSSSGPYNINLVASNIYHCYDTSYKTIDIYPYPKINSVIINPSYGCQPLKVTLTVNATDALNYIWDYGDNSVPEATTGNQVTHDYIDTGEFTVRVYAYSYTACGDTVTLSDTVTVHIRPTADFEYAQDSAIYPIDGTVLFTNTSVNAVNYQWDFADGGTSTDVNTQHRFETVNNFDVMLIAISNYGCRDTSVKSIAVLKKALYVPNALSPDYGGADSLIRIWKPVGIGLRSYHAAVYDKWGKLLWESSLLNNTETVESWNGTYLGAPCSQDVYVWKVDAVFIDGEIWKGMTYQKDEGGGIKRIGSITLIR